MIQNFLSRLMGKTPGPAAFDADEAELAIAALLVRLARADDHYDEAERRRIDAVLAQRRGLSAEEAAALRIEAEGLEAEASDTVRFTKQIKDHIALEDRRGVLSALWEVALADQARGADEDSLIRLVAGLLGVSDRDSAQIRQQVMERTGLRPA
ncbi:TerB family tellurite resistance protein [Paracoccus nototheniae]|uniref:TerB family tellurite resistance protein n=1 Tax=Paracoccus nototheniae TaxID=2489002 RepID=A0ABW4E3E9_9RHOB|nr:TerB family tellurite resistance protein [Paracoccus nototheniae]